MTGRNFENDDVGGKRVWYCFISISFTVFDIVSGELAYPESSSFFETFSAVCRELICPCFLLKGGGGGGISKLNVCAN